MIINARSNPYIAITQVLIDSNTVFMPVIVFMSNILWHGMAVRSSKNQISLLEFLLVFH